MLLGARPTMGVYVLAAGQMLATTGVAGMLDGATSRMVWGFEVRTARDGRYVWPEALKTAVAARVLDRGQGIGAVAREIGANENMVRKWVRRAEACRQPPAQAGPVFAEVTVSAPPAHPAPAVTETPAPIRLRLRDLVVELPADLPEPAMARVFRAIGALR